MTPDTWGGLLIRQNQQILMRESAGHQGGYVWTFAKTHPAPGERPEETARRAVRERMGWNSMVLGALEGVFPGTASSTGFFVLGALGRPGKYSARTAATRWVDLDAAEDLIRQSWHPVARDRDLAVIAALRLWLSRSTWADRAPACALDWEIHPLPKTRRKLMLDRTYNALAIARIAKGYIPAAMEEKWFAWFDGKVLHLHRSWTGNCIYRVTFARDPAGLRAVFAWANRDPAQFTETDDAADAAQVIALIDDLFIHAPDAPPGDAFLEAFQVLAKPNYLGAPSVVRDLLQGLFTAAVAFAKGEGSYDSLQDVLAVTVHQFTGDDSYTCIDGWHCAEGLGRALTRAFPIGKAPEGVDATVSEALFALFLKARDLVMAFEADPAADWQSHALPQLNALHEWAVAVFLGSNEVLHPGITLADFAWQAADQ